MLNPNEIMSLTLEVLKMTPEERFEALVSYRINAFTKDISPEDEIKIMMLLHGGDMTLKNINLEDVIKTRNAVETEAIIRIADGDEKLLEELTQIVTEARDLKMESKILEEMEKTIKNEQV